MTTEEKGSSPWRDAWHRLSRNRAAMVGLFALLLDNHPWGAISLEP